MIYWIYKVVHILGVVLLIGNVSVTSVWKVFADRTGDVSIVAYAQKMVTITDWTFTAAGIVLTILGGYGMTWVAQMSLVKIPWLLWSQILFLISGFIWLFVLVPIQIGQARMAKGFSGTGRPDEAYRRLARLWIQWGVAATVPLIAAMFLMVAKTIGIGDL